MPKFFNAAIVAHISSFFGIFFIAESPSASAAMSKTLLAIYLLPGTLTVEFSFLTGSISIIFAQFNCLFYYALVNFIRKGGLAGFYPAYAFEDDKSWPLATRFLV